MRIAIVGAGGVGGYFGGLLARAGNDVTFIARGEHLEAIRSSGLRIEGVEEQFTVTAPATDDPHRVGAVDLVLFCVKRYHDDEAIPLVEPLLHEESALLTLQNGVDSGQQLAAAVGEQRVLVGAAYIESSIREPGLIAQTGGPRRIVYGEMRGGPSPRVEALLPMFQKAGISATVAVDTKKELWTKLVFLASFAGVTSLTRATAGEIRRVEETRQLLLRAMEEVAAVGLAQGVALDNDVASRSLALVDSFPSGFMSSMQRDVEAGRPLELEALSGIVWRLGRGAGIATPVHEFLYRCLKPADQRGRRGVQR